MSCHKLRKTKLGSVQIKGYEKIKIFKVPFLEFGKFVWIKMKLGSKEMWWWKCWLRWCNIGECIQCLANDGVMNVRDLLASEQSWVTRNLASFSLSVSHLSLQATSYKFMWLGVKVGKTQAPILTSSFNFDLSIVHSFMHAVLVEGFVADCRNHYIQKNMNHTYDDSVAKCAMIFLKMFLIITIFNKSYSHI